MKYVDMYFMVYLHDFAFVMHKLRQRYAVMLCNNHIFSHILYAKSSFFRG